MVTAAENRRRLARMARWAGGALGVAVIGVGIYGCATWRAIDQEIASTPRDPQTGVILGAEAIWIHPPDGNDRHPGRAVLMLHGFLGSRSDFADLGERLAAEGLAVRMARLPGHGTTPRDFAAHDGDSILQGARAELEALREQFDQVDVVGFSMGGALGTMLAAEGGVDRLVLIAPYYGVTHRWWYVLPIETWLATAGRLVPYVIKYDRFIKVNRTEAREDIFSYRVVSTRGSEALIDLGRRARRPETLEAVRCPVLMIHSESDEASCPHRARRVFERIAGDDKRAVWVDPRNNHHLLWDHDREAIKAAVVEWLQ